MWSTGYGRRSPEEGAGTDGAQSESQRTLGREEGIGWTEAGKEKHIS